MRASGRGSIGSGGDWRRNGSGIERMADFVGHCKELLADGGGMGVGALDGFVDGGGIVANHVGRLQDEVEALRLRVAELENRLIEQELTVRHTLAMLVEWLESDQQLAA